MSDTFDPGPNTPTIQSLARAGRGKLRGSGWEAGKRISFLIFLVLVMLVPLGMVEGVVQERGWRKDEVAREIGDQWGPPQVVSGPALVVPYDYSETQTLTDGQTRSTVKTRYLVFTPDSARIDADAKVEKRYKSIYEVPVYAADIALSGKFGPLDLSAHGVAASQIKWQAASLVLGISEIRAVKSASLNAAGGMRAIEAGLLPYHPFASGVYANIPLTAFNGSRGFDFAFDLTVNGRDDLSFQPIGRQTKIVLKSNWPHPGFSGAPLPDSRDINAKGFTAEWSISHIATGAPLSWRAEEFKLEPARMVTVGAGLVEPGDVHQQTDRIVKYGILVVGLTFGTIFVVGLLKRDRVHLVQYLLIGASLSLFYLLLLSLAEQMDFLGAYVIASLVDIAIVAWYAATTIRRLMGAVVGAILAALHVYMYVLLQMESFALLSGTIGLLLILVAVMFVTRKVDWFAIGQDAVGQEPKQAAAI
ncbi:MAG TPA: cell envelope integrity protein CreD [Dongiaceae bacterium]|nr:cell envelope integrity protein CreD [Dongiaceae bacterium]